MSAPQQVIACLPLEEANDYWRERIRAASSLFLFLDFDGTLSPIAAKPELAQIDPQTKQILKKLRDVEGIQLAVVSGRQLADVRAKTGIEDIIYAGNHGLEIETDTVCFQEPKAESLRLELRRLVLRLQSLLSDASGIEIEPKGLGVSVHYRQVHESLHEWIRQSVQETINRTRVFQCVFGKMVVDVRPAVRWNKGSAVRWLLENHAPPVTYPVYIGDDVTDEDAFSVLTENALTIRAGYVPGTNARFWVPDVCAVREFLAKIWELRTREKYPRMSF